MAIPYNELVAGLTDANAVTHAVAEYDVTGKAAELVAQRIRVSTAPRRELALTWLRSGFHPADLVLAYSLRAVFSPENVTHPPMKLLIIGIDHESIKYTPMQADVRTYVLGSDLRIDAGFRAAARAVLLGHPIHPAITMHPKVASAIYNAIEDAAPNDRWIRRSGHINLARLADDTAYLPSRLDILRQLYPAHVLRLGRTENDATIVDAMAPAVVANVFLGPMGRTYCRFTPDLMWKLLFSKDDGDYYQTCEEFIATGGYPTLEI